MDAMKFDKLLEETLHDFDANDHQSSSARKGSLLEVRNSLARVWHTQSTWTREEVDERLQTIMSDIHKSCVIYGQNGDHVNYEKGANIAGFVKVADAMLAQGVV